MTLSKRHLSEVRSELSFWACFAVVLALLSQALFPPQVMAATVAGQTRFVLCVDTPGVTASIDINSEKLLASQGKSKPYQGLKCADCVIASVTGLPVPAEISIPVSYTSQAVALEAAPSRTPEQARAPPRPFSCGPPSDV